MPADRPNILFLMSDEHRADVTGYEGDPVVRTPLLDELARTGVAFRNAYTPSPVCVPGRQCMMAGQLPSTCGCLGWIDLPPGHMTFARRLSQEGYAAVCAGKLHHLGHDQMMGWTKRIAGDFDLSPQYIEGLNEESAVHYRRPFGDYKWSDAKEIKRAGIGRGPCVTRDERTVEGALDFIEQWFCDPWYDREQPQQPLLLKVSLLQPHYPYLTDHDRFTYYLPRVTPYLEDEAFDHPFLGRRQVRPGVDAGERDLRRATAAYYGMVETVDAQCQRVVDALEQVGQDLDDWVVIYTSDHGEMLGEHGIWEKQKFFEASARVPLLVRWPRRFGGGRVVQENVNLCDLFATLCDLTDMSMPDGLDSRSLVPLWEGRCEGWDDETISQFGRHNVMIKRGALKYQWYGPEMPEVLFDLGADPGERVNVVGEVGYREVVEGFRRRRADLAGE